MKLKAKFLRKKHELEVEEQRIKHAKEQLDIEAEIAESEADAAGFDSEVQFGPVNKDISLNPLALEWPGLTAPKTDDSTQRHNQLLAALHLSHAEMIKFDGNIVQYWSFIRSFENSVERICDDDR